MLVAPLVSMVAELHETEHATIDDSHFDTSAGVDDHAIPAQDINSDEDSLHYLAHVSHCCGHIVALLPNMLQLVTRPIQSALYVKVELSHINFLRIPHFRPPINF